ncbi:Hypothetical predicted protein [Mytilus galloprovincialis]|uniref:Integrase zinc-binding domain-containing protein n=1 Tax=Mytilus galloprovincialis TaxID=29158 RepID=A0A8B6BMM2_MYTGA|nr:Hypothetical predicted protein [Mytilus galloprovincialis]
MDAHINHLHEGVNSTVTHLRQVYWIPRIRQRVKVILRKCVNCRKVTGHAYQQPDPPPLPKERRRLCWSYVGDIIKDQKRRGFIERRTENGNQSNRIHYIPHHAVKKDSSTTPIRIVYDCSCHESPHKASLNDCLMSVPPMLNDLTGILARFRLHKHAVTTDIEKAFLNVELDKEDRDVTRFFWLSDPSDPDSPLITYRFRVVLFGTTCSPYILNATLMKHFKLNSCKNSRDTEKRPVC